MKKPRFFTKLYNITDRLSCNISKKNISLASNDYQLDALILESYILTNKPNIVFIIDKYWAEYVDDNQIPLSHFDKYLVQKKRLTPSPIDLIYLFAWLSYTAVTMKTT